MMMLMSCDEHSGIYIQLCRHKFCYDDTNNGKHLFLRTLSLSDSLPDTIVKVVSISSFFRKD